MDEITKAYVLKLEHERDAAIEHAADMELDLMEAHEHIVVLLGQLRIKDQDANYPVDAVGQLSINPLTLY
jgi:hypothetical protein